MTPRTYALGPLPFYGRGTSATPAVVALPGWQRTLADFDWLLAEPALAEAGVLALDLPGFGQTPLPEGAEESWGTPEYADALAEALRAKDIGPVVLLGHSFGGRVAVRLAGRHPDVIRGVVLTGVPLLRAPSAAPARKPPLAFRAARVLHRVGVLPDAAMESARRKHGSADYRAAGPRLRPVLVRSVNDDYTADLAALAGLGVPVALVWGERDTAAPAAQVTALTEQLSPIVVTVGEGKGHQTPAEMRPELVAATQAVLQTS